MARAGLNPLKAATEDSAAHGSNALAASATGSASVVDHQPKSTDCLSNTFMEARARWPRRLPLLLLVSMILPRAVISCSEQPISPAGHSADGAVSQPIASGPPGASVRMKVQVPTGMHSAPFDVDRYLVLPPGFSIAVYARVQNARFMAVTPDGNLLVSQPAMGRVKLIRPRAGGGAPLISDFVAGLQSPHDLVFHTINGTIYLYVAESHRINRYVYRSGDRTGRERQIVVSGLPFQGRPGLQYNHELKNIALDRNHQLYVMLASSCDACVDDTRSNPKRGAIYRYSAVGGNRRLFAQGLRNAEGLAFVPGTNTLWAVVNQQNAIRHPESGELIQSYVDDHPPEEFTRVRDGGNYGWPFCNPNPDTPSGLNNMPFDRDYVNNRDGRVDCGAMDRATKGIQAHSAPLGLTFLQGTSFPAAYRQGAVVALHGSGLRSKRTGYKVIYFPWVNGRPGTEIDLVRGWLTGETRWGRPVDVAVNREGHMFISDDFSGTIYKLLPSP